MEQTTGLKYIVYRGDPRNKRVHLYSAVKRKPVCNAHGVNGIVLEAEKTVLNNGWEVCAKCLAAEERNARANHRADDT